jgi:hypothetical protein
MVRHKRPSLIYELLWIPYSLHLAEFVAGTIPGCPFIFKWRSALWIAGRLKERQKQEAFEWQI